MDKPRQLVYNAIKTPDGKILVSYHRHDYKQYEDTVSEEEYMVDGGIDYCRRNLNTVPYEDLSVYLDEPFERVRKFFHWGTSGKNLDQTNQYRPLCEMSTNHIESIIDGGWSRGWVNELFEKELEFRVVNPFGENEIDNEVLADIRNKLGPISNLIALVDTFLKGLDSDHSQNLQNLIRKEIPNAQKSVNYIAKK